ncbi:MAG: asparagine synthase (glutamine-hydrolyzing) [Eggerthellaceae bacterium]|nr:asparagine synthase (glutamine-hydrolyzing) [Eggerthellaceae bacterium]
MCGFVGFYDKGTDFDHAAVVKAMADSIAHRGPDSDGFFSDDAVSLGFRRLSIIDLEGANQPLYNEDDRLVMCFNGEIYNFQELRAQLIEAGHTFRTHGDGEVILHGFEEWGEALLPKLRGMFAFAIYDRQTGRLFLARDPFGIKPLYYWTEGEVLIFASETKALLHHPHFKKALNTKRLAHYLTIEYLPDDETMFEGVHKVPAGHWLSWQGGALEVVKWWEPSFDPKEGRTRAQEADEIAAALQESVNAHAIADVEVGCFLSAGVDSSLVANETSHIMKAKTFSIGYGEQKYSELDAAKTFADAMGLENYSRGIDADAFFESVPAVQYHMDDPLPNPSAVPLYHLAHFAAEQVKVVLSGEGADELFGGYPLYQEGLDYHPYMSVPAPLRKAAAAVAKLLPEGTHGRRFLMRGAHPLEERYRRLEYNYTYPEALSLLKPEVAAVAEACGAPWEAEAPLFAQTRAHYPGAGEIDEVTAMQTVDILTWMQQDILLKADKMSMAASLELRVPFLDMEVFALSRTLPTADRVSKTETKCALRSAAAQTLPPVTAKMPKIGFITPLAQWMREEPYASRVREKITGPVAARFFNTDQLGRLLDQHISGEKSNMKKIWSIYSFVVWYEQFFPEEAAA